MDKHLNTAGYDLYEVSDDVWALDTKLHSVFVGTFGQVVRHAVSSGFLFEEIETAIRFMLLSDHNAAHFGMGRSFI